MNCGLQERKLVNKAGKVTGIRLLFNQGEQNGANAIKNRDLSGHTGCDFLLEPILHLLSVFFRDGS